MASYVFLRPSPKQFHKWAPLYLSNLFSELTYRTTLLQTTWSEYDTKTNAFNLHEMSMRCTQVRLAPAHQLISGRMNIQTKSVSWVWVPLHQMHGWLAALQTCLATTPLKLGFLLCRMCSLLFSPSLSPTGPLRRKPSPISHQKKNFHDYNSPNHLFFGFIEYF